VIGTTDPETFLTKPLTVASGCGPSFKSRLDYITTLAAVFDS